MFIVMTDSNFFRRSIIPIRATLRKSFACRACVGFFFMLTAFFASAAQFGNFTYTDDGASITITGYPKTAGGPVSIPEMIDGKPVTGIGKDAFYYCTGITQASIPSGVRTIGDYAFCGCGAMTGIELPSGLESIGSNSFSSCSKLSSITLPVSLNSIGDGAFYGCSGLLEVVVPYQVTRIESSTFTKCGSLRLLTLPEGLTGIDDRAFAGCGALKNLTIPAAVSTLGEDVFNDCSQLMAITVNPGNPVFRSVGGVLFNKSRSLLIRYPAGISGGYSVPVGVTVIGKSAFLNSRLLTAITLPAGVSRIEEGAFMGCVKLDGIEFPTSLTFIGEDAFSGCAGLRTVVVPAGVTEIGGYAFYDCTGLESVSILSNAPNFGALVFRECVNLKRLAFAGNAPTVNTGLAKTALPHLVIYHLNNSTGFTSPTWQGYPTVNMGTVSALKSWLIGKAQPFDASLSDDANRDGVNLLLAYALNLNPNRNLSGCQPKPVIEPGILKMSYYAKAPGVTYTAQFSPDMKNWTTANVSVSLADVNGIRTAVANVPPTGGYMRLVVSY